MTSLRLVVSVSLMAACYQREPEVYATLPEPIEVQGPPGGEIDPAWQASYPGDNAPHAATASLDMTIDQSDPASVTAQCTDGEIDSTLDGYGEWVELEGYGRVWRPYTTVVGVNFTPYETCGSWVWTDYGWTFACEWDWGWLPFHYGRWGWFDEYWAWQPGYDWSPAWVDWRGGGGYVGWRPSAPLVRDHRDNVSVRDDRTDAPRVRDHRHDSKDWQWRFAAADDFGKPRIRAHLFKAPAEALRVTASVSRAPLRAMVQPVRAQSIMHSRLRARATYQQRFAPASYSPPSRPSSTPSYAPPSRPSSTPSYSPPSRPSSYSPPSRPSSPPIYSPPSRSYDHPSSYSPPSRSTSPPSVSGGGRRR